MMLPAASTIRTTSTSVTPAPTDTEKPPLGLRNTGVTVLRVTLRTVTVSREPAVPCVPVTSVNPAVSGIVAARLPAGGTGGGLGSRLVNDAVKVAASGRPLTSVIPVPADRE